MVAIKINEAEYTTRINALRNVMSMNEVDIVIAFSNLLDPSAVRYYTDFAAVNESAALIVPLNGEITVCSGQASYDYCLIKNKLAGSAIKVFPEIGEVSGFEYDFEGQLDFKEYFKNIKAKYKIKKIGLVGKLIFPAVIYNKLCEVFCEAEIIDFDSQHYELRVIKSADEVELIRCASEIVSSAFAKVIPEIRTGMTELEIQAMLESSILKAGCESYVQAFAPMVATGSVNSNISMCRSSSRKVCNSEILNIASGGCYEGYNGIICSPYVLGAIPQKISDAVMCAYEALNEASLLMKSGVTCDVVMNAYTKYLSKYGYIEYCPYGSLHSTGMLECEAPIFTIENKRMIKENMTICIDAYFKGMEWGSFRIEDNYVITSSGAERMTRYNDAFIPKYFGR